MVCEALDHFVILVPDVEAAIQTYGLLLGRDVDWQHVNPDDGTATALFYLENTNIELMGPKGDGPVGARIKEILGERKGALTSLAFRTSDIRDAHFQASRRGLKPEEIISQAATYGGLHRSWSRVRLGDAAFGEVKGFLVEQKDGAISVRPPRVGSAVRLDHLVINTGNPDRAMALYGAKLGVRLALDRTNEKWGARFLFFRTGDVTLEIIQRLDGSVGADDKDQLWGMTYEVDNLDDAHLRLGVGGVQVSEVRAGRKPGTRVMSVKSHDLGVPTLLLDKRG
ncbi:VOC family protein [Ponticaulis sp.]|uniref:VOC family protein n=1 Tax=Ponticaulis sp. TaxID=2020902 RepID=UPI000B75C060|nr:VOC family protein [Ponticaulis sp.]MAI89296.1 glyoxalase [Ponticaulis sp.]OUY01279.1 MAG: hypothetical protein CBB65_02275 [Hyphomonadaceae bacterium TMED5]|tara:strand:- start:27775 stop:28620 length:846 start_codon:yes stop_codon:yes gene_type:complete